MSMPASEQAAPVWPVLPRWAATPLAWALLATLFLVVATLVGPGPSLTDWLGDTDDATRLVTVRELLAGAPLFDTTLPRIGAPTPLLSHWSRLIDAPLALMIAALSPLVGPDRAELATRILWPALLFLALAWIVAREAERRCGLLAAAFVFFLVTTSSLALAQFRPGRIDHHNAQILCAVAGLIFLARSPTDKRAGWIAGALLGLGLAIGYEAIALVVPALALAALVGLVRPEHAAGPLRAAAGATLALVAALALTVSPLNWFDVRCDALSLNLPLLAAYVTAGLWAACSNRQRPGVRVAILGLTVACGTLLFAALEPACLAGPFGQVDAALRPIWLDHVIETSSIFWLASNQPAAAFGIAGFLCAGAAAQIALVRRRPDIATGLATAFILLAVCLALWQIKLMPYACWLAALSIAVWAAQLTGTAALSSSVVRIAAVVLLSQATLESGFAALIAPFQGGHAAATGSASVNRADPRRPCYRLASMHRLGALPPGLVAADIDLGPYIVAGSPHRVVAAPYHRLAKAILANHAILDSAPQQGLAEARALGVGYIALCADFPDARADGGTLRSQLLARRRIDGLDELPTAAGAPIRIWQLSPTR
jgi:hypothetical protein